MAAARNVVPTKRNTTTSYDQQQFEENVVGSDLHERLSVIPTATSLSLDDKRA
jgi:hypothetical protein